MVPDYLIWWNGLTQQQRDYLTNILSNVSDHSKVQHNIARYAYLSKDIWHKMIGWPSHSRKDMEGL